LTAFVCILRRDGRPVGADLLRRLAAPLEAYGGETATHRRGPLGIALRRLPPAGPPSPPRTPSSTYPPAIHADDDTVTAVAGRFHPPADVRLPASPADLTDDLLGRSTGAFALVSWTAGDASHTPHLTLARDHLGSQPVCYHLDESVLVAASDPAAVLRHPALSLDLDEAAAVRFLAFRFSAGGGTFFRGVRELPPGHRLDVAAGRHEVRRYWRFRASPPTPGRSPGDAAGELRRALTRAVARDVEGLDPSRVAVSLSGGLDSTAVAAVAPRGVRAFSWTFEETPEADERERVEAVSRHLGLPVTWVPGDGLHPLTGDFVERFVVPASPQVNPFAALKAQLYATARAAGCRRVLVGDGGDVPYAGREWWLRDLLAEAGPGAGSSLAATLGRALRGDRFARRALGRLLPDGPRRALAGRLRPAPPWLTPLGRRALPPPELSPILPPGPRRHRHELAFGAKHSELESGETRLFALCGVERGNPFWSWPLLETAAQLPAHLYHRDGRDKLLSRLMLADLLPPEVVEGKRGGLLGSFFLRGLEENRGLIDERVFRHPRSDWPRYVRRDWLQPHLADTSSVRFGHTVLWRVICYELWQRRLAGDPAA